MSDRILLRALKGLDDPFNNLVNIVKLGMESYQVGKLRK